MRRLLISLLLVSGVPAAPLVLTVEPPPPPTRSPDERARDYVTSLSPETRERLRASYQDLWKGNEAMLEERVQQAFRIAFVRGMVLASTGRIRTQEDAKKAFFPIGCDFQADVAAELNQRMGRWVMEELMPVMRPMLEEGRREAARRRSQRRREAWAKAKARENAAPDGAPASVPAPAEPERHLILEVGN
jgi:hypothetical protein